jgi:hypothetical protein
MNHVKIQVGDVFNLETGTLFSKYDNYLTALQNFHLNLVLREYILKFSSFYDNQGQIEEYRIAFNVTLDKNTKKDDVVKKYCEYHDNVIQDYFITYLIKEGFVKRFDNKQVFKNMNEIIK